MVVIDPISNYWGKVSENSNAGVRSVLKPLQMLAEELGVAFVLIQHVGKSKKANAQQNPLGSTGIVAACRSVWGVYIDPNDGNKRLFAKMKANCGFDHTTVSYRIAAPEGKVEVLATDLRMTADEIEDEIAAAKKAAKGRKANTQTEIIKWLLVLLADGGKPCTEIYDSGRARGYSENLIDRAKSELGIKSIDKEDCSVWELPTSNESQNALASVGGETTATTVGNAVNTAV